MQMENENKIISPEEEVSLLKERITQLEGESEEKTLFGEEDKELKPQTAYSDTFNKYEQRSSDR